MVENDVLKKFGVLDVKVVPIDKVRIAEEDWSPNFMEQDKYDSLKKNIKRFGYRQFIEVKEVEENGEKFYEVIDGRHRLKALKELGYTDIVVIVVDNGSREYDIVRGLSANNLKGKNIELKLAMVLDELSQKLEKKEIAELTGYSEKEIEDMINMLDAVDVDIDLDVETEKDVDSDLLVEFVMYISTEAHKDLEELIDYFIKEIEADKDSVVVTKEDGDMLREAVGEVSNNLRIKNRSKAFAEMIKLMHKLVCEEKRYLKKNEKEL